ncbi:MAG: acyl-[Lachnospiraceae bacterium]|nr:acyl-[acyl-carrier-protein] thioesterase [Lachnospiraceae bacterium]
MYSFSSRVRYTEIDQNRNLDLHSILNYFQDCSNFHSVDVGVGIDTLTARHRVWLLSAWQVELFHTPRLFDQITVATWPYDFKGLYGYRNFVLYNESHGHEVAACANSIWFLVDTETMRPTKITSEDSSAYPLEEPYPMTYEPRRITLPEGICFPQACPTVAAADIATDANSVATAPAPIAVTEFLLDTNLHVNNAQYVRIAKACLPADFQIRTMRAEYRKSAVLGDIITPVCIAVPEKNQYFVSLNDPNGQPFAIVEFRG